MRQSAGTPRAVQGVRWSIVTAGVTVTNGDCVTPPPSTATLAREANTRAAPARLSNLRAVNVLTLVGSPRLSTVPRIEREQAFRSTLLREFELEPRAKTLPLTVRSPVWSLAPALTAIPPPKPPPSAMSVPPLSMSTLRLASISMRPPSEVPEPDTSTVLGCAISTSVSATRAAVPPLAPPVPREPWNWRSASTKMLCPPIDR